jgi:hypothetical protein
MHGSQSEFAGKWRDVFRGEWNVLIPSSNGLSTKLE